MGQSAPLPRKLGKHVTRHTFARAYLDNMADEEGNEWMLFFNDLEVLLSFYEQNQRSNDIVIKERLSIRLENAVKALQNISVHVSDENKSAVQEITRNFQMMYWDCRRAYEFPTRTRCTQVAVMSLDSPSTAMDGHVGRPKFDIKADTLIELRALDFSWENIASMLLVSRWTVYRRASEFGLSRMSRFSDISDEQLDNKVRSFINEHGNLIGSSMVWGWCYHSLQDLNMKASITVYFLG